MSSADIGEFIYRTVGLQKKGKEQRGIDLLFLTKVLVLWILLFAHYKNSYETVKMNIG